MAHILDPCKFVLQQVEEQYLHTKGGRSTSERRNECANRLALLVLRGASASARVEEIRHRYLSLMEGYDIKNVLILMLRAIGCVCGR